MPTHRDRYREKSPGFHAAGSARALAVGVSDHDNSPSRPMLREHMTDVIGNRLTTNHLELHQDDWVVGWVSGVTAPGFWECNRWLQYQDLGFTSLYGEPDDMVAGTTALARANPSRPSLDVWTFLYEMKDIPRMVKQVGHYMRKYGTNPAKNWPKNSAEISRDIGSAYLGWTFGWDQLFRDLNKMFDFSEAVSRRTEQLTRLASGDLRRTITVFDDSRIDDPVEFYCGPLYQAECRLAVTTVSRTRVWVRVRYVPSPDTIPLIGADLLSKSRSLVFGHELDLSTVWNALPWSWLEDWFTTAGDYFAANRNHLKVITDDVAIMRHSTRKIHSIEFSNNPGHATFEVNKNFGWSRKKRERYAGGPVIALKAPYLGPSQLSILAALAAIYRR